MIIPPTSRSNKKTSPYEKMDTFGLSGPSACIYCSDAVEEVYKGVQYLLDEVEKVPRYKEAYRLDEAPLTGTPRRIRIVVTVSPTDWFETLQRYQPGEIIQAATQWIRKTRENIVVAEHGPSADDRIFATGKARRISESKAKLHCAPCDSTDKSCDAGTTKCCTSPVDSLADPSATCKSYIWECLVVEWLTDTTGFYLLQSPKARRELVLVPKPGYEPQGDPHLTNEDLVGDKAAWKMFMEIALRCSVRLEMNFGQWERMQHDDLTLQSCHGHVHFYFAAESWADLFEWRTQSRSQRSLAKKMQAIRVPAPDRRVQDCDELEQRVLRALELEALMSKLNVSSPTMG